MLLAKTIFILALIASVEGLAQARASCWPSHNAVSQRLDLKQAFFQQVAVKDQGYSGSESRTVLNIMSDEGSIELTMSFRESFEDWGSPQNVYALMVLDENGFPLFFEDFTGGCRGVGLSFFPRQELKLATLKKASLSSERIHIILWSQ